MKDFLGQELNVGDNVVMIESWDVQVIYLLQKLLR